MKFELTRHGRAASTRVGKLCFGGLLVIAVVATLGVAADCHAATTRGSVLIRRDAQLTRVADARKSEAQKSEVIDGKVKVTGKAIKPSTGKSVMAPGLPSTKVVPQATIVHGPHLVPQAAGTVDADDGQRRRQRRGRFSRRGK